MSLVKYYKQIRRIFGQMLATLHRVLPENRRFVDDYVNAAWTETMIITMNLSEVSNIEASVEEHFVDYISDEDSRMEESLSQLGYSLKGPDAVRFIVDGPLERVRPFLNLNIS